MKTQWKSEAQYQAECTKMFDRKYPEQRGRLMLIYNNPPSGGMGAILLSMGLRKGISDQVYFAPHGVLAWIEYKLAGRKQSKEQIEFQLLVESYGFKYFLCEETISEFENIINQLQ